MSFSTAATPRPIGRSFATSCDSPRSTRVADGSFSAFLPRSWGSIPRAAPLPRATASMISSAAFSTSCVTTCGRPWERSKPRGCPAPRSRKQNGGSRPRSGCPAGARSASTSQPTPPRSAEPELTAARGNSSAHPGRGDVMTLLLGLLALVAGALIPVQAAANAALSKSLQGSVGYAALTLFAVAGATTIAAIALIPGSAPSWGQFRAAPAWSFIGGAIVAVYVLTITFLAPRLGVGAAISLIVTGQILAALLIDHYGLMRSLQFPLTPGRLAGAALMIVGAFLALR